MAPAYDLLRGENNRLSVLQAECEMACSLSRWLSHRFDAKTNARMGEVLLRAGW
jgi:hypothetical protein